MRGWITRGWTAIAVFTLLTTSKYGFAQAGPFQVGRVQTFTTFFHDYEAMGINPANIASHKSDNKKFSIGLLSGGFLFHSGGIKRSLLHGGSRTNLSIGGFSLNDVLHNRNAVNVDNTIIGFNVNTPKTGSFAFSVRSNVYFDMELRGIFREMDYSNADLGSLPDIISQTIEENPGMMNNREMSYLRMNAINEVSLGYSKCILNQTKVQLFVGGAAKYVMGMMDMGMQFNGQEVAGVYALSSLIPDEWEENNYLAQTKSDKKFGHGAGANLGVSMKTQKFRAGVSVIDLGFIRWPSKHLYFTNQDVLMEVVNELDAEVVVNNMLSDFQRTEDGMEMLPARIIVGGSFEAHRYIHFYLDVMAPIVSAPRSMENPTIGIGTRLSIKDAIVLRAGPTLTNRKLITLPMYLSFFGGKYKSFEMSFGSSDFLSFFLARRDYLQMDMALMKFHF